MNFRQLPNPRNIVFVTPHPAGESLRGARAVGQIAGVCLLGIAEEPPKSNAAAVFGDFAVVKDAHDSTELIAAARMLAGRHGPLERMVTVHETLLAPVARAEEALGLSGMLESTVMRALDKSQMKHALKQAGIATARDRVATSARDVRIFAERIGFPLVLKPLTGSGGLATRRIATIEHLEMALRLMRPAPGNPLLVEAHLKGEELCIDTVTIADEPRFHSLCLYYPTILEALDNPQVQWRCVMPRDLRLPRYKAFIDQGLAAVRALRVGNAMTHLEGFIIAEGEVCFIDATLRPAGARIGPMLAHAYDIDPYRVWARVAVDGCFDGPWQRSHAVGTIFLRGPGTGRIVRVEGCEEVNRRLGAAVVDSRLPWVGEAKSETYTGDGFITVRHPETEIVHAYLDFIADTVVITYNAAETALEGRCWLPPRPDIQRQHCRPVWDDDSLSRSGDP